MIFIYIGIVIFLIAAIGQWYIRRNPQSVELKTCLIVWVGGAVLPVLFLAVGLTWEYFYSWRGDMALYLVYAGLFVALCAAAARFYIKRNATPSAVVDPIGMGLYFMVFRPGLPLAVILISAGLIWWWWRG